MRHAIDLLQEEHRIIERVVGTLQATIERLQQGGCIPSGFFLDASDFFRDFLFPMAGNAIPLAKYKQVMQDLVRVGIRGGG